MFTLVLRTSNKDIVEKENKNNEMYLFNLISLQTNYNILDLTVKYMRGGPNIY